MPIVPGYRDDDGPPGKPWKNYDRGVLSQLEAAYAFLDNLGDDNIILEVKALSHSHRELLLNFLRSIAIEDIPPGLFIPGNGITPEFEQEWSLYRQAKAHVILSTFGSDDLAEDG